MKNYRNSDYALNKHSDGIVYRFANQIIEVSMEDYLAENPAKTEEDFKVLKAISDEMFHQQDLDDYNQTRKNIDISNLAETTDFSTSSLEDEYIEILDKQYSLLAVKGLFDSGILTEVQQQRFALYFFKGLSLRQIAEQEGVTLRAIAQSVNAGVEKLKMFFEKF